MSSVCDDNGQWWYHCQRCKGEGTPEYSPRGKWVKVEELEFEKPSREYPCGLNLCPECFDKLPEERQGVQEIVTISLEGLGLDDPPEIGEAL